MNATRPYNVWCLLLIILVVGVRVVGLAFSPLQLHGDEAQYFSWSRDLAGGYFSKPPLIAWVIRGATEVFGTGEWAIRMWSPVAHGVAAGFLFAAGRNLFDDRTGFWAALAYLTLPGIVVSSGIASTDALLLMFVALSLWAWSELRAGGDARWGGLFAVAIGLGLMSKYAMLFIATGYGLLVLLDAPTRRALLRPLRLLMIGGIVALLVAPNVAWNLANDFATAGHTVANANLSAELLNPLEGVEFAASQFGVMGPVMFALFLVSVVRGWREPDTRALAILALLPLSVILFQAFLSRANANWAASAYVPGTLLVVAVWLRSGWDWTKVGVGVNALIALAITALSLSPALTDALGLSNSVKRVRGWNATVAALSERVEETGAASVAVDNRITFYALDYYGLGEGVPMRAWQMDTVPHSHAELTRPLLEGAEEPILFVNYHEEHLDRVLADFGEARELEPLRIDLGGGKMRELDLWLMRNYRRAPRD